MSIDESVVSVEDAEDTGVSIVESSVLLEDDGETDVSTDEPDVSAVGMEDTVVSLDDDVEVSTDGDDDTVVSTDVMDDELTASKELLGKDDDELTLLPTLSDVICSPKRENYPLRP